MRTPAEVRRARDAAKSEQDREVYEYVKKASVRAIENLPKGESREVPASKVTIKRMYVLEPHEMSQLAKELTREAALAGWDVSIKVRHGTWWRAAHLKITKHGP